MWVVCDKDGQTYLRFFKKPYKDKNELDTFKWKPDISLYKAKIPSILFPDLKWEDEPIEVKIVRVDGNEK